MQTFGLQLTGPVPAARPSPVFTAFAFLAVHSVSRLNWWKSFLLRPNGVNAIYRSSSRISYTPLHSWRRDPKSVTIPVRLGIRLPNVVNSGFSLANTTAASPVTFEYPTMNPTHPNDSSGAIEMTG